MQAKYVKKLTAREAGYATPCTVTLFAPNFVRRDLKKGGPEIEPTFPDSDVPRAKTTVTSVQQFLFKTPFSVSPPPEPWYVQVDAAGVGAARTALANRKIGIAVKRIINIFISMIKESGNR
jgi:hypothetical protein